MSDDTNDENFSGLDKLLKVLKNPPTIRVGILGTKAARANVNGSNLTNADIGAFHEFGTSNLPVRSFLRIPIMENLDKRLKSIGVLDKESLREIIAAGSLVPVMKKIGVIAEGIVSDAFDTGGFGKWPPSDMRDKANHQTLIETAQLRDSITSDVKESK